MYVRRVSSNGSFVRGNSLGQMTTLVHSVNGLQHLALRIAQFGRDLPQVKSGGSFANQVSTRSKVSIPIEYERGGLRGKSRSYGDVSNEVRLGVIDLVLKLLSGQRAEIKAVVLAIIEQESGFNPDAANTSSSAAGLGQIVEKTGKALGLRGMGYFDAEQNLRATVELIREYQGYSKVKNAKTWEDYLVAVYSIHHDGPTKDFGGEKIAVKQVLPRFNKWLEALRGSGYLLS